MSSHLPLFLSTSPSVSVLPQMCGGQRWLAAAAVATPFLLFVLGYRFGHLLRGDARDGGFQDKYQEEGGGGGISQRTNVLLLSMARWARPKSSRDLLNFHTRWTSKGRKKKESMRVCLSQFAPPSPSPPPPPYAPPSSGSSFLGEMLSETGGNVSSFYVFEPLRMRVSVAAGAGAGAPGDHAGRFVPVDTDSVVPRMRDAFHCVRAIKKTRRDVQGCEEVPVGHRQFPPLLFLPLFSWEVLGDR